MRSNIFLILLFYSATLVAQNPHGPSLKIDCATCHSPDGWEIAPEAWRQDELVVPGEPHFSHDDTDFPLTGKHNIVDCRSCHATLVFEEAPSTCIGCHTDLHQMTVGDDCTRCHTTEHWLVDNITQLHFDNGFPLLGNHAVADCRDCHTSETDLRFDRIGNDCINCHLDEYLATTSPNHPAAGFSTECADCHDIASPFWFGSGAGNHSFFPLTKGHAINDCTRCHIGGNFVNTPTECVACHLDDFQATTNPDHEAAGFPTDCTMCHTTDPGWNAIGAGDHSFFPLTEGHAINDCTRCHIGGNFVNTPTECVACHLDDFQATTNPNHVAAGFPTDCTVCHSTAVGWPAEDFSQHDQLYFPIFSGKHDGQWNQCAECHTIPGNFKAFSCIQCHEHNDPEDLEEEHDDVSGYSYSSPACYSCHPNGEE